MKFTKNLIEDELPLLWDFIKQHYRSDYVLLDKEFFDWFYLHNPYNPYDSYAMKIIKYKDSIIGINGIIPAKIKVDERVVLGASFANLMVDEKARAFGMGARLIEESSDEYPVFYTSGAGIHTVPMYEKMGNWTFMGSLRRFIRIIDVRKCSLLAGKPLSSSDSVSAVSEHGVGDAVKYDLGDGVAEGVGSDLEGDDAGIVEDRCEAIEIIRMSRFDGAVDKLWSRIFRKYPITLERSSKFLNYRYSEHPLLDYDIWVASKNGQMAGYAVLRTEKAKSDGFEHDVARIVDFISDDDVERCFLSSLLRKYSHCAFMDFFFSGSHHTDSLKKLGFVENKPPYDSLPMLFNPLDRKRQTINWLVHFNEYWGCKDFLTSEENWYITRGDCDQDRPN